MQTHILKVLPSEARLGSFAPSISQSGSSPRSSTSDIDETRSPRNLDEWHIHPQTDESIAVLRHAAEHLRTKDTPVAFPTETVYGLGADATRSAAVRGIYQAKGRPSDNPLIVHVADLHMLRDLLRPDPETHTQETNGEGEADDYIPQRYRVLVERFWPGPLTILLPNPHPSRLAPEVTAGLATFGARMPSSPLALSLIKLAGVPLAAPSANASTKPSPTTAQHVMDDLDGRIEIILDGGACSVGVESTVVDGLCEPPVVLRPGGVGIDEIRGCEGWEGVRLAYRDSAEGNGKGMVPRAPGMKYKHYSPRARVVLYEASWDGVVEYAEHAGARNGNENGNGDKNGVVGRKIGVIRTQRWERGAGLCGVMEPLSKRGKQNGTAQDSAYEVFCGELRDSEGELDGRLFDIDLGKETRGIAQGLFSALRELDGLDVDVILVDGIRGDMDIAAAVMNRLRKAASEIKQ